MEWREERQQNGEGSKRESEAKKGGWCGMEPGRLSYRFLSLAAQLGRAISRRECGRGKWRILKDIDRREERQTAGLRVPSYLALVGIELDVL